MYFDYAQYKQKGQTLIFLIVGIIILAVVVGGAYYFSKSQTPKPQPQNQVTIPQTPQSTIIQPSSSDETAGWKTYTNQSIGLSFMYPSDAEVEEKVDVTSSEISIFPLSYRDGRTLSDPELATKAFEISVNVRNNNSNLTVQQVVDLEIDLNSKDPTVKSLAQRAQNSIKLYTIGQVQGIYIAAGEAQPISLIYIVQNGKIYKISYLLLQEDPAGSNAQAVIDKILSTFKFLNEGSIEGRFCGGIAANLPEYQCPSGYKCQLEGDFPDAGGKCVKK